VEVLFKAVEELCPFVVPIRVPAATDVRTTRPNTIFNLVGPQRRHATENTCHEWKGLQAQRWARSRVEKMCIAESRHYALIWI
jgi:hypothetical protein